RRSHQRALKDVAGPRFAARGKLLALVHLRRPTRWRLQSPGGVCIALGYGAWGALGNGWPQNAPPRVRISCSTIGPRAKAGKYVSAPTIRMVPISSPDHSGPYVGNVPSDTGTRCFLTMEPAIASRGTIIRKRPMSMASPIVVLYQGVLAPS